MLRLISFSCLLGKLLLLGNKLLLLRNELLLTIGLALRSKILWLHTLLLTILLGLTIGLSVLGLTILGLILLLHELGLDND